MQTLDTFVVDYTYVRNGNQSRYLSKTRREHKTSKLELEWKFLCANFRTGLDRQIQLQSIVRYRVVPMTTINSGLKKLRALLCIVSTGEKMNNVPELEGRKGMRVQTLLETREDGRDVSEK